MQDLIELTEIEEEPRFGDVTIFMDATNPSVRIFRKTRSFTNEEEFHQYMEHVEERKRINSDFMIALKFVESDPEALKVSTFFEYPEDSLRPEELKPDEAIKVFREILESICFLKDNKIVHGDIRPEYITFSEADRRYKLVDRLADTSQPLKCQLNNIDNYKALYMAPVIFDDLSNKAKSIKQNSYKSDLFSLGMVVLGAFKHPDSIQELYDLDAGRFDVEGFEDLLSSAAKNWSEEPAKSFLEFLVANVLIADEKRRASPAKAMSKVQTLGEGQGETQGETNAQGGKASSGMIHYNPWDFVKPGAGILKPDEAPGTQTIDNEVVRFSEAMSIAPIATEKSLIITNQRWDTRASLDPNGEENDGRSSMAVEEDVTGIYESENVENHQENEGEEHKNSNEVNETKDAKDSRDVPEADPQNQPANLSQDHPPAPAEGPEKHSEEDGDIEGYFKALGLGQDEDFERLEDKIGTSGVVQVFSDAVEGMGQPRPSKSQTLSELIRQKEKQEPKKTKQIGGNFSFISPKSEQPVAHPKKLDMSIQSNYKILKPSVKRSDIVKSELPPPPKTPAFTPWTSGPEAPRSSPEPESSPTSRLRPELRSLLAPLMGEPRSPLISLYSNPPVQSSPPPQPAFTSSAYRFSQPANPSIQSSFPQRASLAPVSSPLASSNYQPFSPPYARPSSDFKPSVKKRIALASTQQDSVEQIVQKLDASQTFNFRDDFQFAEARKGDKNVSLRSHSQSISTANQPFNPSASYVSPSNNHVSYQNSYSSSNHQPSYASHTYSSHNITSQPHNSSTPHPYSSQSISTFSSYPNLYQNTSYSSTQQPHRPLGVHPPTVEYLAHKEGPIVRTTPSRAFDPMPSSYNPLSFYSR